MKLKNFADMKNGLDSTDEDIVMGIDAENHRTLLNSLTHLYSNPVMAAFREYCANASDAHKDSGQTKPFDITFPYRFEGMQNLRIRDYGKGMTEEQITKIYSQYGATTKANNNAQVGGFGLGSKSGLAVSNHLYVNTIANGILIKAKVLKNANNESVIRILSRENSSAPSGTEIILPLTAAQLSELTTNAEEELVGYKPTQVKLNGERITNSVHDKKLYIPITVGTNVIAYIKRNDMSMQNSYGLGPMSPELFKTSYSVIMGGVYYPSLPSHGSVDPKDSAFVTLIESLNNRFKNSPKVIMNVPVGSVDLPPHRDAIIDTAKTWESLKGLFSNLHLGLKASCERYLNDLSMTKSSEVVGSMRALFAPNESWIYQGKTYLTDVSKVMSPAPYLYSRISGYYNYGHLRLEGKIDSGSFTRLQTRNTQAEYNYNNRYNSIKKDIVVVNLEIVKDKYDEVVAFDANEQLQGQAKIKMKKPRIQSFLTRYLLPVLEDQYPTSDFYVVITAKDSVIPEQLSCTIKTFTNEEKTKVAFRMAFPPAPKKVVEQKHCRITQKKLDYSLIQEDEKVVYFAGKDAYGTEQFMHKQEGNSLMLRQTALMKQVATGARRDFDRSLWAFTGLLNLIEGNQSLIALGSTRSEKLFKKSFADAVPLGEVVMNFYDNLEHDRKLAVQHAYSIIKSWNDHVDTLFSILGETDYYMNNRSIQLMFQEPELVSVAYYLFAFKDNYVKGLVEWKKEFVASLEGKELACRMLLPLQSLLGQVTAVNFIMKKEARKEYSTTVEWRGSKTVGLDEIARFADKLTS
jgi:hypothetical protein